MKTAKIRSWESAARLTAQQTVAARSGTAALAARHVANTGRVVPYTCNARPMSLTIVLPARKTFVRFPSASMM